jgi:hypothetical protein
VWLRKVPYLSNISNEIAGTAAGIAKLLFFLFLILSVVALITGRSPVELT